MAEARDGQDGARNERRFPLTSRSWYSTSSTITIHVGRRYVHVCDAILSSRYERATGAQMEERRPRRTSDSHGPVAISRVSYLLIGFNMKNVVI